MTDANRTLACVGRGHCAGCWNPYTECSDTTCPCHRPGTLLYRACHRIARVLTISTRAA